MVNDFAADLLVRNCGWMWQGDKVIFHKAINQTLVEVITLSEFGTLRDYLITYLEPGVPYMYLIRSVVIEDDPSNEWYKVPESYK